MKAIEFPEVNLKLAEDQAEYQTIPVHVEVDNPEHKVTCCFELSDEEIAKIIETKKLWYVQLTFGNPFQPIFITTEKPPIK